MLHTPIRLIGRVSAHTRHTECAPPARVGLCCRLQWGATVYSHRKANDDHIKVAALVERQAMAAEVTDDRLAIRIPNAPGGLDWGVSWRLGGWVPGG